jgi:hypothetical protein
MHGRNGSGTSRRSDRRLRPSLHRQLTLAFVIATLIGATESPPSIPVVLCSEDSIMTAREEGCRLSVRVSRRRRHQVIGSDRHLNWVCTSIDVSPVSYESSRRRIIDYAV